MELENVILSELTTSERQTAHGLSHRDARFESSGLCLNWSSHISQESSEELWQAGVLGSSLALV